MAYVVQVPRINPTKWRDLLRSIWDADPGLTTAKITFNALYAQFQHIKELRAEIRSTLAPSLKGWDQQFEWYRGRLSRYRALLFDWVKDATDPLTLITTEYAKPVFNGDYSAILGDPDAVIDWPGFVAPQPSNRPDAMVAAELYNQLLEVVALSDQQAAAKWPWLATCFVIPAAANPACLTGIAMLHDEFVTDSIESAKKLGADISKAADDAANAVSDAIAGMVETVNRAVGAASEGISFGLKAVGVALALAFGLFIYTKATEDG